MLARLRDDWVYGGVLAAVLLLALTPVLARGWPLSVTLVWLHLPVYMLHQYEEHVDDRFRRFVNATIGGGHEVLTRLDTFIINIPGVWGVNALAFALAALERPGLGLIAVYLSLLNAVAHVGQAIAMRRGNPGLVSAVLLFLPLGLVTLWVFRGVPGVGVADHALGLAVSAAIHGLIVARTLTRKRRLARRT